MERNRKQARKSEEDAAREKIRDERLAIAKLKHEKLMQKHFEKEMNEKPGVKDQPIENTPDENEADDILQYNPGNQILQDSDDVSDVSDISELETITGGAHRPLKSFQDADYIDTWTVVVPA